MTELRLETEVAVEPKQIRDDHSGLFATRFIAKGDVVVTLRGGVLREPTRYSVQIGEGRHADNDGLIENTNHSCAPSAFLDLSDPAAPQMRALRDIQPGAEITFNYCASEEDMSTPFDCACGADRCYGTVRGHRHLTREQRADIRPLAPAWLLGDI